MLMPALAVEQSTTAPRYCCYGEGAISRMEQNSLKSKFHHLKQLVHVIESKGN